MSIKKLFIVISLLLGTGCSLVNTQTNNSINESKSKVSQSSNKLMISEQKGATIEVKFDFSKSFNTKASTNGTPAKTINDINSVKLYLTKSNGTNPLLASNVIFSSPVLAYTAGSTSQSYTFNNVPSGTYFVATELFSDNAGTQNIIEPLTYDSINAGDTANGFTNGKRGLTLSSNSCTVAPTTLTVTFSDASNAFKVAPALLNALGATLDTTVSPTNGGSVSGNVSVQ